MPHRYEETGSFTAGHGKYKSTPGKRARLDTPNKWDVEGAIGSYIDRKQQQAKNVWDFTSNVANTATKKATEAVQNVHDYYDSGAWGSFREGNKNWLKTGDREGWITINPPTTKQRMRSKIQESSRNLALFKAYEDDPKGFARKQALETVIENNIESKSDIQDSKKDNLLGKVVSNIADLFDSKAETDDKKTSVDKSLEKTDSWYQRNQGESEDDYQARLQGLEEQGNPGIPGGDADYGTRGQPSGPKPPGIGQAVKDHLWSEEAAKGAATGAATGLMDYIKYWSRYS